MHVPLFAIWGQWLVNCIEGSNFNMNRTTILLGTLTLGYLTSFSLTPGLAQSIIPGVDHTNTVVTPQGQQFDISGGQLSGNGDNLFHSFQEFG